MQTHSSAVKTADGFSLYTQSWLTELPPKASIFVSHGYAEHLERYQPLAEFLVAAGYNVYALDHRGHGKSEGERANIRVFRQYIQDLKVYIDQLREEAIVSPVFLLGHSMGAAIATQFILEHPHKVDGLIVSGSFLRNATQISPILLSLSGIISKLLPSLPTTSLDATLVSRDQAIVEAYQKDPLIYHGGTKARLGTEMLAAGPYILERASALNLPLLVMHGGADQIADKSGSQELYNKAGSSDKTLKIYDDFYHEIFNELSREEVYKDVLSWLNARV
ncbi:MAG: lysophospholipase [Trueperaceae bacterium]|nr:lysophospholipase [Trueperaceae bacterium]